MKNSFAVVSLAALFCLPLAAAAQVNMPRPLAAQTERPNAQTHWPDAITCHFPARPALDQRTGLPTGELHRPFTQIARLTLAPAMDGHYYYGTGPIHMVDDASDLPTGRPYSLPPGALLGYNADGNAIGQTTSDCNGRSIGELIASGQAR